MSLAESVSKMTLENVHPGGYFWKIARGDRDQMLLRLATAGKRLVVVAHSTPEAEKYAERLTLSGLPVTLADGSERSSALEAELQNLTGTVVTTHDFAMSHGPIPARVAVHLRPTCSLRPYARRLEAVPAAIHVTFVAPDEIARADALLLSLRKEQGNSDVIDVTLEEVIDLTDSKAESVAEIESSRRRFPLRP